MEKYDKNVLFRAIVESMKNEFDAWIIDNENIMIDKLYLYIKNSRINTRVVIAHTNNRFNIIYPECDSLNHFQQIFLRNTYKNMLKLKEKYAVEDDKINTLRFGSYWIDADEWQQQSRPQYQAFDRSALENQMRIMTEIHQQQVEDRARRTAQLAREMANITGFQVNEMERDADIPYIASTDDVDDNLVLHNNIPDTGRINAIAEAERLRIEARREQERQQDYTWFVQTPGVVMNNNI